MDTCIGGGRFACDAEYAIQPLFSIPVGGAFFILGTWIVENLIFTYI